MPKSLGALIRERRQDLGLTQEELAKRVGEGIRQSEISRLEHDRISLPRRERLEQVANALDLSIGDLLVLTGWMDDEHRRSLEDGATPAHASDGDTSVSQEVLAAAVGALEAAKQMVIETANLLDQAERNLAESLKAIRDRPEGRGMASPYMSIIGKGGKSSAIFRD